MEKEQQSKYVKIFHKYYLLFARCFGSKSGYRTAHPNNLIIFNSRIYTIDDFVKYKDTKIQDWFKGQEDEIWYGDLNLNEDINKLRLVATELKQTLAICNEMGYCILIINPY